MNKYKKILIVVLSILCLYAFLEVISYGYQNIKLQRLVKAHNNKIQLKPQNKVYMFSDKNIYAPLVNDKISTSPIKKYNSHPIFVFGGYHGNIDFINTLSEDAKSPVYGLTDFSWGVQHMYFLLKNYPELQKEYKPETIIYVYSSPNKYKLSSFSFDMLLPYLNLRYKIKNGELQEQKPLFPFIYKSYFVRNIERFIGWRKVTSKNIKQQQEYFDLLKKMFEDSKKIAYENEPELKNFIILRFPITNDSMQQLKEYSKSSKLAEIEYNMWESLINDGITVIDINDITEVEDNGYKLFRNSIKNEFIQRYMPKFIDVANIKPQQEQKTVLIEQKVSDNAVITKKQNTTVNTKIKKRKPITKKIKSVENSENTQTENEVIIIEQEQITEVINDNANKKSFWSKFKRKKDTNKK